MAMAESDRGETASSKEGDASWGTFEELLLACAVCRHGTTSWESIAMEVQTHTNNAPLSGFTPHSCRQRYNTLKRRFDVTGESELRDKVPSIVDELRKIRVAELRREVERHDVSIVSLELKVKRLEEERVNKSSEREAASGDGGSDLSKRDDRPDGSDLAEKSISGDRSFNESNSTNHKGDRENRSREAEAEAVGEVGRCEEEKSEAVREGESGELRESVSEVKQGSDVQSSARRGGGVGDEMEAEEELSPANKRMGVRSQPLIKLLGILRSHQHSVVFQRRLPTQETEEYRSVVRQYMDLEMVKSKLDLGIYCDSQSKFYRDILLVFTNATLFFRKNTTEHMAAHELRKMVIKEIAAQRLPQKPKPAQVVKLVTDLEFQIEPVVKKPRTSTNIVVCRRRTNPNAIKPSSLASQQNTPKGKEEDKNVDHHKDEPKKLIERSNLVGRNHAKTTISHNNGSSGDKSKEMVQGESNNSNNGSANNNKKGQKDESSDDEEEQPINKRRRLLHPSLKKQGVVNFLKRIKQNSPSKEARAGAGDAVEEQEEKMAKKMDISKSKVVATKKDDDGGAEKDDNANQRRVSGRRATRVGDSTGNAKRGSGRPPTRKATTTAISVGTPDSGKGKRQRDSDREKEAVGTSGKVTITTAKKKSRR